jgi:hypothetical protein
LDHNKRYLSPSSYENLSRFSSHLLALPGPLCQRHITSQKRLLSILHLFAKKKPHFLK